MARAYVRKLAVLSCLLSVFLQAGCGSPVKWAGKKIVAQEKQEIAEATGLSKTKEELREEIRQTKSACDRDVSEVEKKMDRQKEECSQKEAELKKQLKDLKEAYDRKQAELEQALEKAK